MSQNENTRVNSTQYQGKVYKAGLVPSGKMARARMNLNVKNSSDEWESFWFTVLAWGDQAPILAGLADKTEAIVEGRLAADPAYGEHPTGMCIKADAVHVVAAPPPATAPPASEAVPF